ncbi:MAG: hypothetical protein Q4C41_06765 [Eggerthellaceae bacterium]|nr:hypothetical protein [Eggerthellaceae bacterium]
MGVRKRLRDDRGQMTVELAVVFPVVMVVALVAVNALAFFSACAEFDRVGRNAVRIHAASPAYEQGIDQSIALVQADLDASLDAVNVECSVSASRNHLGHATFELTLRYWPTLFGLGLRSEVFGVPLPSLVHIERMTVDVYKPGMLL